jgi:hypothetical protein
MCSAPPRASAQHLGGVTVRTLRVSLWKGGVVLFIIPVTHPLRHIAGHIQSIIPAFSCRITAYRAMNSYPSSTLSSAQSAGQLASHTFAFLPSKLSPQGEISPSGPCVAYSHSASVGSRASAHVQYASASYQETRTTGWSSRSSKLLSGPCGCCQSAPSVSSHSSPVNTKPPPPSSVVVSKPVPSTDLSKCVLITSVCLIQNAFQVRRLDNKRY